MNNVWTSRRVARKILEVRLSYGHKLKPFLIRRSTQRLLDGVCAFAAIVAAYSLRFDFSIPTGEWHRMWIWAGLLFLLTPLMLSMFGGYRATWQFFGVRDFIRLAWRVLLLTAVLLIVPIATPAHHLIPSSVIIIEYGVMLFFASGIRLMRRLDHEALLRLSNSERILIIGTEATIAAAIRQLHPLYGRGLAGIVMDESYLLRMKILGIPVLGNPTDLSRLIILHRISLLFLCSADLQKIPNVIQVAADLDVPIKFLPSVQDLIGNRVRVSKNVTVDALQTNNSNAIHELHPAVLKCLNGRTVLVTGAGGSIGSELARQVARADIKKLILLDQDENAVFELLGELGPRDFLTPVIADIRDRNAVRTLFDRERPAVVLHAAAYKHVPMMELNACEAVLNNVGGTRILAEAAVDFGAERLVMISSDKAVRPSSVMGATKRLAEVIIQRYANTSFVRESRTNFACVRFGNVLGSRGSVLPLFLKQIAQGGPITVTHEDMTRYFMTIPQAAQLVLQAATLASCGDVYMLDMGDPVRIMTFAREIIQLSGLTPDKDIDIKIVGSRPGEKLHEQLWNEDAHVTSTEFEHVYRVKAQETHASFEALLENLELAASERRPEHVRAALHDLQIDYLTEQSDTPAAVLHFV